MVNNLLLVRLQNVLENDFFSTFRRQYSHSATGLLLTQEVQCGQAYWWLELHSE